MVSHSLPQGSSHGQDGRATGVFLAPKLWLGSGTVSKLCFGFGKRSLGTRETVTQQRYRDAIVVDRDVGNAGHCLKPTWGVSLTSRRLAGRKTGLARLSYRSLRPQIWASESW